MRGAWGAFIVALAIAGAAHAEPVTLLCSGSGISVTTDYNYGEWTEDRVARDFSFEVVMDLDANSIRLDGRSMHLWTVSDDEVVFYGMRKGVLGAIMSGGEPYKISRRSGAFTSERGTGRCERIADRAPLF